MNIRSEAEMRASKGFSTRNSSHSVRIISSDANVTSTDEETATGRTACGEMAGESDGEGRSCFLAIWASQNSNTFDT